MIPKVDTIYGQRGEPGRAMPVVGTIVGAYPQVGDPPHYDPSATRYTIRTTIPGIGAVVLQDQVPQQRIWANAGVWINAESLVNSSVEGYWIGGAVRWYFVEPPSVEGCSSTPTIPPGNTVIVEIGAPAPADGGSRGGFGPAIGDGPGDQTGGPADTGTGGGVESMGGV